MSARPSDPQIDHSTYHDLSHLDQMERYAASWAVRQSHKHYIKNYNIIIIHIIFRDWGSTMHAADASNF